MKEEKDIDRLFKDGLENPDIAFNEHDWDLLEDRLHPRPKRKVLPLYWLATAAGVAAILFIIFTLPEFNKYNTKETQAKQHKVIRPTGKTITPQRQVTQTDSSGLTIMARAHQAPVRHSLPSQHEHKIAIPAPLDQYDAQNQSLELDSNVNLLENGMSTVKLAIVPDLKQVAFQSLAKTQSKAISKKRSEVRTSGTHPTLVLGIVAAPDLTGVQKSGKSSLSGGLGIDATLILTKRLSITTGIAYAKKIYDSDFSLYNPQTSYVFKNQPSNIHANCDVLDIPLNLNYKLTGNRRNALSLSAGLSSYLMLKEDYYYSYQNANPNWPQSFEVKNQNQHFFGIANIGVSFQHQISDRLNLNITPFVKIPLTNIGYGNSKLSSTGIAVSVNMVDLFRKKSSD